MVTVNEDTVEHNGAADQYRKGRERELGKGEVGDGWC
jgi:hypothetical protein